MPHDVSYEESLFLLYLQNNSHVFTKSGPNKCWLKRIPKLWQHFITVSERNSLTKLCFKSRYEIYKERQKHVTSKYKYIIHPFSLCKKYIEICSLLLWTFVLIFELFHVAFYLRLKREEKYEYGAKTMFLLNMLVLLVVFLHFFTGYFHEKTQKVVINHKKVAIHYIRTWFFVDVIPILIFWYHYSNRIIPLSRVKFPLWYKLLPVLRFIRLGRIITICTYLHWITNIFSLRHSGHILVRTVIFSLYYLHFTACLYVLIPDIFQEIRNCTSKLSWINQLDKKFEHKNVSLTPYWLYVHSLRENLIKLDSIGVVSGITPYNEEEILLSVVFNWLGTILQIYAVTILYFAMGTSYHSSLEYTRNLGELDAFCTMTQMPDNLSKKLTCFSKKFYRGHSIEDNFDLTNELNYEMLLEVWKGEHVKNCKLFQNLVQCGFELTHVLKPCLVLQNTAVYSIGEENTQMYFICSGSVAVFNNLGVEIGHLWDGNIFGVCPFKSNSVYTENIVAVEDCRMFTISKQSLILLCEKSVEFHKYISDYQVEITKDTIQSFQDQMPSLNRLRPRVRKL